MGGAGEFLVPGSWFLVGKSGPRFSRDSRDLRAEAGAAVRQWAVGGRRCGGKPVPGAQKLKAANSKTEIGKAEARWFINPSPKAEKGHAAWPG